MDQVIYKIRHPLREEYWSRESGRYTKNGTAFPTREEAMRHVVVPRAQHKLIQHRIFGGARLVAFRLSAAEEMDVINLAQAAQIQREWKRDYGPAFVTALRLALPLGKPAAPYRFAIEIPDKANSWLRQAQSVMSSDPSFLFRRCGGWLFFKADENHVPGLVLCGTAFVDLRPYCDLLEGAILVPEQL